MSVPLRPTTIRFASDAMDLVNKAAEATGVSTAQFVREAAVMRAMLALQQGEYRSLAEEVQRLSRRDD
jgi:uncharacterized protein (DUF1778 family)